MGTLFCNYFCNIYIYLTHFTIYTTITTQNNYHFYIILFPYRSRPDLRLVNYRTNENRIVKPLDFFFSIRNSEDTPRA